MTLEVLKATISSMYTGTKYPVSLLDNDFHIVSKPLSFFDMPKDFFAQKLLPEFEANRKIAYKFDKTEFYFFIKCNIDYVKYVVIGPILYPLVITESNLNQITFFKKLPISDILEKDIQKIPVYDFSFSSFAITLYNLINNEILTKQDITATLNGNVSHEKLKEEIDKYKFHQREESQKEYSYNYEKDFLFHIKRGDSTAALVMAKKITDGRTGDLSKNMLTKSKYLIIASITLITRTVIEAGVDVQSAYSLSDMVIQKIDTCSLRATLTDIHTSAIMDFCALVKNNKYKNYPLWIRQCMDYIQRHLHEEIYLEDIAVEVHRIPSYVSVQFKKITGFSLKTYINNLKIEEAKHLLLHSDLNLLDISTTLAFSSQGYFSSVFKNSLGITPSEYRKNNMII